jgi:hypothetical protein
MAATFQGGGVEAMLSVDALLRVEEEAKSGAVGSAQRAGTAAPVTPTRAAIEETLEDEAWQQERMRITGRGPQCGQSSSENP